MRRVMEAVSGLEPRGTPSRTVRCVRAFLLPQIVSQFTGTPGRVTRSFVREGQLVARGQDLFELQRHDRSSAPQTFVLRASNQGIVARCWARVGDAVERARPMASMIRCDDVLVLGLFERALIERMRLTMGALVTIGDLASNPFQAGVLRIGTALASRHARDGESREFIRALVQIPSLPPQALRPGLDARVDLLCE